MDFQRNDRSRPGTGPQSDGSASRPGKTTLTSKLPRVLRKASGTANADVGATYARATSGAGAEVPYRAEMEHGFGSDFSTVHAFTGRSSEMAALGAEAATRGSDNRIAFADATPSKETVAHELAHVVQAHNGAGATGVQAQRSMSEPGDASEREADAAAATVAGGGTIAPGSLSARGSGIQRKDVEMSAGGKQKETESTTRVVDRGNQFEDQSSAWGKLVAWKKGQSITFASSNTSVTRVPTDIDALSFFYELTPNQRHEVWMNTEGVLTHIFTRFTKANAAKVMSMCDFPLRWKIYHWFKDISVSGGFRDFIRSMISNSPLGQRLEVVQNEQCVDLMSTTFADDHPENLFGDAIKAELYPDTTTAAAFDKLHPKFAAWRDKATKLDAESRWALVGTSPVANIATLKATAAAEGRNQWTSLVYWGPRGLALSPTMRQNIDKAALDSGVTGADRADLFQARWNVLLTDPGAPFNAFKTVWTNLQQMPFETISSDVVRKIELRIATSGGAYNDIPTSGGYGEIWVGTSTSLAYVGHTVRHEIGHGADTKLGGFASFSSKPPIVWKKWQTEQPWLQEILRYMDAPGGGTEGTAFLQLMQAALAGSAFVSPLGAYVAPPKGTKLTPLQEQQKLWQKAADAYNSNGNDLGKALDVLKKAGKHTASSSTVKTMMTRAAAQDFPTSEPRYVRDHYFLKKYGEHFSYHHSGGKEVWKNKKLRDYTLCSPYEYYADMFAAYFETDTKREKNVPAWAAGYFKQLESSYDAKAADDPKNTTSTVYSSTKPPQVE